MTVLRTRSRVATIRVHKEEDNAMKRSTFLCMFVAFALLGCANVEESAVPVQSVDGPGPPPAAAETFSVEFVTTKGNFTVEVHPEWAPVGAEHFRKLVEDGFYDNCAFFRAMAGFMVQFGISGEPAMNDKYEKSITDDPVRKSNKRGFVTYAKTSMPDSRSTQLFINLVNNANLDSDGFAPFGVVVGDGMKVVDSITTEYGNPQGDFQGRLKTYGQPVLDKMMPNVDYIKTARIVGASEVPAAGF